MIVKLSDIEKGKPVSRRIDKSSSSVSTPNGSVLIRDLEASLQFKTDSLGYSVFYHITFESTLNCIRCEKDFVVKGDASDSVSLRTAQPQESHLNLEAGDMNTRFITQTDFDVDRFVDEIIELELPSFPRHQIDDPACAPAFEKQEYVENAKNDSPFSVLSKFLN